MSDKINVVLSYTLIMISILVISIGAYIIALASGEEPETSIKVTILGLLLIGIGSYLIITFMKDVDFIATITTKGNP